MVNHATNYRGRDAHALKNGGKRAGPPGQLCEPMLHKPVTNNQAQRNRETIELLEAGSII